MFLKKMIAQTVATTIGCGVAYGIYQVCKTVNNPVQPFSSTENDIKHKLNEIVDDAYFKCKEVLKEDNRKPFFNKNIFGDTHFDEDDEDFEGDEYFDEDEDFDDDEDFEEELEDDEDFEEDEDFFE